MIIKQATPKTITTKDGQTFYYVTKNVVTTKEGLAKAQKQLQITKKVLDKEAKYGIRYIEKF